MVQDIPILVSLCRRLHNFLASLWVSRNEPLVLLFYDTPGPAPTLMALHDQCKNEGEIILYRIDRIDSVPVLPMARHTNPLIRMVQHVHLTI